MDLSFCRAKVTLKITHFILGLSFVGLVEPTLKIGVILKDIPKPDFFKENFLKITELSYHYTFHYNQIC